MDKPEELFSLLSDPTRLRSMVLIHETYEMCVCEFSKILETGQPKISRHLALLRLSGLAIDHRRGQWMYYQLSPHIPNELNEILTSIVSTVKNVEPYKSDLKKMKTLRKSACC